MKILHLIGSLTRGGMERQLCTIVKFTEPHGFDHRIVYFNEAKNNYIEEYNLQDKVRKADPANRKELLAIYRDYKPDLVYAWDFKSVQAGLYLSFFAGAKFINGSIRHGIFQGRMIDYYRMVLLHLSKYIVANNKSGIRANKLKKGYVLYNGLDTNFLSDNLAVDRPLEKGHAFRIISMGHLTAIKNYSTILKALSILNDKGITFHYTILGDGLLRQQITDEIAALGLNGKVELKGSVPNVKDFLYQSDIFVHASKGEGCSNAILEAMAAGLPVIVSNVGGNPEITSEENAYRFEYPDYKALASYLEKVITDPQRRIAMGHAGRETINTRFSIERMVKDFEEITHKIAGR